MCVVAIATGNQTINGDTMKLDGTVVNDCHAEVLCRRSLLRELLQYDDISATPDVHEPLYIDIRKTGLLRCKVERAQGTLPVDAYSLQTLDGITGGERLQTMSCSDKLLKWNVLGLQGALLGGLVVEPIYLNSITVGNLYHHGHMSRAVCCRASHVTSLPPPYRVNHPSLSHAGVQKWRNVCGGAKSKSITVVWNAAESTVVDVLDGSTGLTLAKEPSRFCKSELFKLFKALKVMYKIFDNGNTSNESECYLDAKMNNGVYQLAKKEFFKHVLAKKYGVWIQKPVEEKLFC